MTYEVFYTTEAQQDLIEIFAYGIETWGEKQAENMYNNICSQLEDLYFFPYRTKAKGTLGTREKLILNSPYRAIISIDDAAKSIFILRILHTSRDVN